MSVSVCCPRCQVTCVVPPELLGRSGRCNKCGRRVRLASPVAELLDEATEVPTQPELASLDELATAELLPIEDLPPLEPVPAAPPPAPKLAARPLADEDDWPDSPVLLDGEEAAPAPPRAPAKRNRRVPDPVRRGPSAVLLALLAFVGLVGGGAGGVLLIRHFTTPEPQPAPEVVANDPPAPVTNPLPAPNPAPPPPVPNPPVPNPKPNPNPDPKPKPNPDPPPPPPKVEAKNTLKLPGAVATMTAGGGGRYIVFQMADTGQLATFDAKVGRVVWTLNGAKPDDFIAAGRQKLFIGKKDARVDRLDLATAAGEGVATMQGAAVTLKHLAVGSASDGPLLMVTHNGTNYRVRLIDGATFAELGVPIDDPTLGARGFPFSATTMSARVAVSADGRAIAMSSRYFVRQDEKYRAGLISGAGILFPAPDGQAFVGSGLYSTTGLRLAGAARAGVSHRYVPAASGPFIVSAEYSPADPGRMKLFLHLGAEPNPLGPLPGGELVGAWAKIDPGWMAKLQQRLIFVPDPGLVVFCPPGADVAHVLPVDLSAMLREVGHEPVFTSVAPAETRVGRAYSYRATVAGTRGPVTFTLETGPAGMQMTKDGLLTWQVAEPAERAYDVRIAARDPEGHRAVQSFRLLVWKEAPAIVVAPKKPDVIELPKKPPAGDGRSVKLPGRAVEQVAGGNGRFVFLNMPTLKQVAVFDVKEARIVKTLPMDEAGAVIAAGRDHLFVVNNEAKTLQRWSLTTFEKESADKLPPGGPFSHAYIGSNATGPLLLCPLAGPLTPMKPLLVDALTLRPVPLEGEGDVKALARTVRVSTDGQTFTWSPDRTARGAIVATVVAGKAQWKAYPKVATPLTPGADGRSFYAYDGVYDSAVVRVFPTPDQPPHTGAIVPAAQGNLFLDVEPGPAIPNAAIPPERARVFLMGQSKPFATIEGLNKPTDGSPRFLHLAPQYGLLVMGSATGTELLLHPFDLDAALAKSATDYLVVLPEIPRAVAGAPFAFAPVVKSKKGGVKLKLDSGPDGMTATPDGRLTWEVPAAAAGREVVVAYTVTDASGQSVPQSFRLTVAAPAVPVPPAPPAAAPRLPVAPAPREARPAAPPAQALPVAPAPRER